MTPEYEAFIEHYRQYLLNDVEVMVDMLDDALMGVYRTGCDDPIAIENWDNFLELLRSNVPFRKKLVSYSAILHSGWIKLPSERAAA